MTTYAIALGDLATGVEWVSQASGYISLGTNRQVYVYLRNADGSQGSEASVFSDTGLSVPLSQPLTAGAQSGALPGYVASGQSLLFVDVLTSDTAQAEALAAAASTGASVTSPDGTISVTSGAAIDVVYGAGANTAAEGNDSRIVGALQLTGVLTDGNLLQSNGTDAEDSGLVSSSVVSEIRGDASPDLYYDPTPNSGESPNFALGTTFSQIESGAYSNQAFGAGYRPGLSALGNLALITTGYDNTAIGAGALVSATTDHSNTAVGADSLSAQVGATNNTAVGAQAAESITTGSNNTAVGSGSLENATTGTNTAVGASALAAVTTGTDNVAVGTSAGASLTTTNQSTFVGYQAGLNIINANNTAVGYHAMQGGTAGATNITNSTAIGMNALNSVTSGGANTAVGYFALQALTTGGPNVAVGQQAGLSIVTGSNNVCVGSGAGHTSTTDSTQMTLIGDSTVGGGNKSTAVGATASAGAAGATALGYAASAGAAGAMALGCDSSGTGASTSTANVIALGTANHQLQLKNNTTGSGSAALGANSPAVTNTAPYTWFKMMSSDGSTVYVPAWK